MRRFFWLLLCAASVFAQRPLTHIDFDGWRSIASPKLSRDGKFAAYALQPQDGDGELVVRNLSTGAEFRAPIGAKPTAVEADADPSAETPRAAPRGPALFFTHDGRYVIVATNPSKAELKKAKKEKKKPEEMPKNGMVILDSTTGAVTRIDNVADFQVPEEGKGWIAYHRPAPTPATPTAAPAATARRRTARAEQGSELVMRNLADGTEQKFVDVVEYAFSKDGVKLVYAVASKTEDENGVFAVTAAPSAQPVTLVKGKGRYRKLTWDDKQSQLAFLASTKLHLWKRDDAASTAQTECTTAGLEASDKGVVSFSRDGAMVFLGCAPVAKKPASADDDGEEKAVFDLWNWKDSNIQPMQKAAAQRERNRTYRASWNIAEKKFVQLADATMADVNPTEDGRWGVGIDDRAYRPLVEYDERYSDSYLVDLRTGDRKQLVKKGRFPLTISPNGEFAVSFDGRDWHSLATATQKAINLTASLGVKFFEELTDTPNTPPAYGLAGWTRDSKYILVYDRYDIWQIAPDGSSAKNLTDAVGRKEHLAFRYVRLDADPRDRGIDPSKPLLLRAENEDTRDTGFYHDRIDSTSEPKKLIMGAENYSVPVKAKDADVMLLTASTFQKFPDLLVTDAEFRKFTKVSDANPQQKDVLWGKSELVSFRNTDGVPLKAILIKPANFDPKKKYPLLVYIYERLTQTLNTYVPPAPRHTMNATFYASNGYLVLMPDIVYTPGYPGQSALKCVLPALDSVIAQGFVDEKAVGIQGHSWGGYEIAYMVTQTNRFRAANAGAPVANMTSAYDGIRWGTGLPRQFQYEKTQSRIGGTLWQYPLRFIENSPIFRADRVETPLMMIANDADDAVPWYQGIEYFLALRRLGKEVYMFNYNGEPHHLNKRPNQKDYTIRMQQFFDHYLKGAPRPEWMDRGIPYIEAK